MIKSGQYTIYKKSGALQVSFLPPTWVGKKGIESKFQTKTGCILFEAAPASTQKDVWDWKNKIIFALGLPDIGTIISQYDEKEVSLIHDNNGTIKKLRLTQGVGQFAGTWMLNLSEGDKKVSVPIGMNEMPILIALMRWAIPAIVGWNNVSPNIEE